MVKYWRKIINKNIRNTTHVIPILDLTQNSNKKIINIPTYPYLLTPLPSSTAAPSPSWASAAADMYYLLAKIFNPLSTPYLSPR
jgi:hypothetical protein